MVVNPKEPGKKAPPQSSLLEATASRRDSGRTMKSRNFIFKIRVSWDFVVVQWLRLCFRVLSTFTGCTGSIPGRELPHVVRHGKERKINFSSCQPLTPIHKCTHSPPPPHPLLHTHTPPHTPPPHTQPSTSPPFATHTHTHHTPPNPALSVQVLGFPLF